MFLKVSEILEKLNGEYNILKMSKEVQISEKKLRGVLKNLGAEFDNSSKSWSFNGDENVLEHDITNYVEKTTPKENSTSSKNSNVRIGSKVDNVFTNDEIEVLKSVIKERKNDYELFSKYRIYDELSKVPTNEETVRNAYNISKSTTTRLKKYAEERRLPLQDLVELAIINLLEKYDKGE